MFNISKIFVTFFYIGYIKFIPGTIGTFFSILIILSLNILLNKVFFIFIFIVMLLLSIFFINNYINNVRKNDPKEVIIDEFLGTYIIFFFIDYLTNLNYSFKLTLIFILFRFFDILKPFPIGWIDKNINNSIGIIFDDLLAGIYTIISLLLVNALV